MPIINGKWYAEEDMWKKLRAARPQPTTIEEMSKQFDTPQGPPAPPPPVNPVMDFLNSIPQQPKTMSDAVSGPPVPPLPINPVMDFLNAIPQTPKMPQISTTPVQPVPSIPEVPKAPQMGNLQFDTPQGTPAPAQDFLTNHMQNWTPDLSGKTTPQQYRPPEPSQAPEIPPAANGDYIQPADKGLTWNNIKRFFRNTNDKVKAALTEFGMGATDASGIDDLMDASHRQDPTYQPGLVQERMHQENLKDISETTANLANFGGMVAGLSGPTMGAYRIGGQFAGKAAGRLLQKSPALAQKIGIGVASGAGTGAVIGTYQEGMEEAGNPNAQTFGQHLSDVGKSAAEFAAFGAAYPLAGQALGAAGRTFANRMPQTAQKAANLAQRAPLATDIAIGGATGLTAGAMVGAGKGTIEAIRTGDPSQVWEGIAGQSIDELKEEIAEALLFGMVHRISGRANPMRQAPQINENHDMIVTLENKIIEKMSDEDRADYQQNLLDAKEMGIPEEQARAMMLDAYAESEQGTQHIDEALDDVLDSAVTARMNQANFEPAAEETATISQVQAAQTDVLSAEYVPPGVQETLDRTGMSYEEYRKGTVEGFTPEQISNMIGGPSPEPIPELEPPVEQPMRPVGQMVNDLLDQAQPSAEVTTPEAPKAKPTAEINVGDKVGVKGKQGEYEVMDTSDRSTVTLRTPQGSEMKVGRGAIVAGTVSPKQEAPAPKEISKKEPSRYGRSGTMAFNKELAATGITEDTSDYTDFESFFDRFYFAGQRGERMPQTNMHPQQAHQFYDAGVKDAQSKKSEAPRESTGKRIEYKTQKKHIVVKHGGKEYKFRHNDGFVTFRGSGLSVSDVQDILGPDADIGEEMAVDSLLKEIDKANDIPNIRRGERVWWETSNGEIMTGEVNGIDLTGKANIILDGDVFPRFRLEQGMVNRGEHPGIREPQQSAKRSGTLASPAQSIPITRKENPVAQEPEKTTPKEVTGNVEVPGFAIRQSKHTKTGETLWVVNPVERLSKDDFTNLRTKMGKLGGHWSNFKPNNGFLFKSDPSEKLRQEFGGQEAKPETKPEPTPAAPQTTPKAVEVKGYHATHQDIAEFADREIKNYNSIGTWFTDNADRAKELYGPKVYEASITLRNPYRPDTDNFDDVFYIPEIASKFGVKVKNEKNMTMLLNNRVYITEFKKHLQAQGYDGIVFEDSMIDLNTSGSDGTHTVYVVFDAKNIRKLKGAQTNEQAQSPGPDGQGTLEEAPAANVPGTGAQRPAEQDAAGSAGTNGAGVGTGGKGTTVPRADTGEPTVGEANPAPRSDLGAGVGDGPRNVDTPAPRGRDFVITDELDAFGGAVTKFRNNVAAIRLLHRIEQENRNATEDEQKVLAKYVGWGGLANAFDASKDKRSNDELRNLVSEGIWTEQDYDLARRSTQYAHYTAKEVVQGMYEALDQLGFTGGRVLEPSMGTGNFFGLMPQYLANTSTRTGVEMDTTSGRLARLLYPNAHIEIKPFQDFKIADGYFDLAIGNPPFSSNTLSYGPKKERVELHNFFFLQSLDKVRDGGIVAFVTSSGTMNARTGKYIREKMGEKADFLGAIRLPGDAFKANAGTEVTTDIIFLQKRPEGKKPKHAGNFFDTVKTTVTDDKGNVVEVDENQYFAEHPEMVLGINTVDKLRYRGEGQSARLGVKSDRRNLGEALKAAVAKLPKNIYKPRSNNDAPVYKEPVVIHAGKGDLDEGGYGILDGKIVQRIDDRIVVVEETGKKAERITGMIGVRDAARKVIRLQRENAPDAAIKAAQKELNQKYDAFKKAHGYLNDSANIAAFKADSIGTGLLLSLEVPDGNTFKKQAIFTERTIQPEIKREKADTATEALAISLFETGRVDFERMAALTGKSPAEVLSDLQGKIYRDPDQVGDWSKEGFDGWVTEDDYLSGNVRVKLQNAERAAKQNPSFEGNVTALQDVQPVDKTPEQIYVQLGSTWIPTEDVKAFVDEFLDIQNPEKVSVHFNPITARWSVKEEYTNLRESLDKNIKNTDEYGVKSEIAKNKSAVQLIEDALNLQKTVMSRQTEEGTITDEVATAEAQAKQKQINMIFQEWLWSDKNRAERLAQKFNWEYNNRVERQYNGSLIYGTWEEKTRLPGATLPLRKHQRDGVWRAVQGKNLLYAHVVGAGKTYTMISAGMEMKRLGMVNKPVYVVPNHLLGQWERDFRGLYPAANLLTLSSDDIPSVSARRGDLWKAYEPKKGDRLQAGYKVHVKGDSKVYTIQTIQGDVLTVKGQKGKPFEVKAKNVEEFARRQTDAEFENRRQEQRALRAAALTKIAVGNYDAILITHKTFEKLPMSPEAVQEFIRMQLNDVVEALQSAQEEGNERGVKDLEKIKENLENKLNEAIGEMSKDIAIPFEELGIDQLFVDEAHMFKNLQFHTKMRSVAGLPNNYSNRAQDMFMKTQYLTKLRSGRGVVYATGTPISNTIAEMFNLMRYMIMPTMRDVQLGHFDMWAANFAEMTADVELNAAGQYKQKERMAKFKNLMPLMQLFRSFADIRTADMLDLPRPANIVEKSVVAPMSPDQKAYMQDLLERAQNMKNVDPREDNWLKLTGDGRKMALDIRLVDPSVTADYVDGKVNMAVENIVGIYKDPKLARDKEGKIVENAAQLVFLDLGTPKAKEQKDDDDDAKEKVDEAEETWTESVYSDLRNKLVAQGIPDKEIAFIHDYKTEAKKKALFAKVNAGEIRVLIGSTEKMGAGMNVQERLVALHHLDAPWRPSDVEQREGRIIRQGNKNDTVYVYSYVTKGSFDALMWGILKRKAEMINQVMNGTADLDEIEDTGDIVFKYAEVEAAAADNPLIQEKHQLEKEVSELSRLKSSHETNIARLKKEIRDIPNSISYYEKRMAENEADSKRAIAIPLDQEILEIQGQRFLPPTEEEVEAQKQAEKEAKEKGEEYKKPPSYKELAGDRLIAEYQKAEKNLGSGERAKIGTYAGFDIVYQKGGFKAGVRLVGESEQPFDINEKSPVGTYQRMENAFEKFKIDDKRFYQGKIAEMEKRRKEIQPLTEKKFEQEEKLREKSARLNEVVRQITQINDANDQAAREDTEEEADSGEFALSAPAQNGNPRKRRTKKMKSIDQLEESIKDTRDVLTPKATSEVADIIAKSLNTVVNEGFVKRGAEGIYNDLRGTAAVRGRSMFDWRVVGHELGHVFSHFHGGSEPYSRQLVEQEMRALALALYPNRKAIENMKVSGQMEEGFAEFFRLWVVDRATAKRNSPMTYQRFEDFIAANKDLANLFQKVRTIVDNDLAGTATGRAVAGVISPKVTDDGELFGEQYQVKGIKRALFNFADYTIPAKAMQKAAEERGTKLNIDLHKLMGLVGDSKTKALSDFKETPRDVQGRFIEGRPLETIFQEGIDEIGKSIEWKTVRLKTAGSESIFDRYRVMGAKEIFDAIVIANRILERSARGFDKLPMTPEMAEEIIETARQKYPKALELAEDYAKTLSNLILTKLERAGIITAKTRQIIEAGSQLYIPFYYDEKKAVMVTGTSGGGRTNKNPVKRFSGKVAPILDVFQATMLKLAEVEQAIEYKRVVNSIHELAKTKKMGNFARVVTIPPKAVQVDAEQVAAKFGELLDEDVDLTGIVNQDFMTFYTPSGLQQIDPTKPVIMNVQDGKPAYIEIAPDIFQMLMAMKPVQVEGIGRLLAWTTRISRYTALASPRYITNAVARDMGTAVFQSKNPMGTLFKHFGKSLLTTVGAGDRADEVYADFLASGAATGAAEHMLRNATLHQYDDSMLRTTAPGWYKVSLPKGKKMLARVVKSPQEILRVIEEAPRLSEYLSIWKREVKALGFDGDAMYKKYLEGGTDALPAELQAHMERILIESGYAGKEITTNFSLHGTKEWVRKYLPTVPFLHGTVQGTYRTLRQVKEHPVRSFTTMIALGSLGLLAYALMAMDEDDKKFYNDMDSTARDKYWWVPMSVFGLKGYYIAFAKPFDYAIPANWMERLMDYYWSDEYANRRTPGSDLGSLFSTVTQTEMMSGFVRTMIDLWSNKTSFGGPIVPMGEQNNAPELQYGPGTSETAKFSSVMVAKLFAAMTSDPNAGVSPRKIDYFIRQTFGKWGSGFLSTVDAAAFGKDFNEKSGVEYYPILGDLVYSRAEGVSRIVNKFYDDYGKAQTISSSAREMIAKKETRTPAWVKPEHVKLVSYMPAMEKVSKHMSDLRKLAEGFTGGEHATPELRREWTMKQDYLEKLAAGILYGVSPGEPPEGAKLTDDQIEQFRNTVIRDAQEAIAKERKRDGGASTHAKYLEILLERKKGDK